MVRASLTKLRPGFELAQQQGGLELGHAIVRPKHLAGIFVGKTRAAAVDDRLQSFVTVETAGQHEATFACGHQFTLLKAETPCVSGCPCALALEAATVG